MTSRVQVVHAKRIPAQRARLGVVWRKVIVDIDRDDGRESFIFRVGLYFTFDMRQKVGKLQRFISCLVWSLPRHPPKVSQQARRTHPGRVWASCWRPLSHPPLPADWPRKLLTIVRASIRVRPCSSSRHLLPGSASCLSGSCVLLPRPSSQFFCPAINWTIPSRRHHPTPALVLGP